MGDIPIANRIVVQVAVSLDPVPGMFHTEQEARETIAEILLDRIPHYNPVVLKKADS